MLENSEVKLWGKKSGGPAQLRQLWKIQHVERDYYSIRSAYRHDLALFADGTNNIKMVTLDTALTPEETPLNLQWRISRDVNSLLARMANSKITVIRTHGSKYTITTSDGNLTRDEILGLPTNIFESVELIIYGACATGKDETENLVSATHDRGAAIVIGFTKNVWAEEVNYWCEGFFDAISQGKTVDEACALADDYVDTKWEWDREKFPLSTDIRHIEGNLNTTFVD